MSKTQKEKTIVTLEQVPVLEELGFKDLAKKFDKIHVEEKEAEKEVARINLKRKAVGIELQAAIEAVQVDSVEFISGKFKYRTTLVKSEPGEKLDESKLRTNLMKMGKLDAGMVAAIINASQTPTEARAAYVLVTPEEI